jgi:SRSO17 transposase
LLPSERRKTLTGLVNTEPVVGAQQPRAQALQWFLSESNWDERKVQAERLRLLREDPATAPNAQGGVVIDETGDRKAGHQTAHVARQYLGNLGKSDNGVVSVTSLWADEQVYYPVEIEPYTPESYFAKGKDDPAFRTKLKIALQLVQQAIQQAWPFRAVVADSQDARGSRLERGAAQAEGPVCAGAQAVACLVASRERGGLVARCGARGRLGECRAARPVGAHSQNVSGWQHAGLVGGGDCGWAVWAR